MKVRVGLTIGDPAGIGPAITLAALKILKNKADLTIIGDSRILAKASRLLKTAYPSGINLVDLKNTAGMKSFGRASRQTARASLEYLDTALSLLKARQLDCLVTCPVSKEAISLLGPEFTGHTEYLAQRTGSRDQVMMLLNDKIKFSLLTRHLPLSAVSRSISRSSVEDNIRSTAAGLKRMFGIRCPRIVVCGVNPHASDNGLLGKEETRIITPVVKYLSSRLKQVQLTGPLPADSAIAQAYEGKFDCVIAAYHDQALIALKLTGFDSGVNLTLGLPFVRTSPLHGTAFDVAARPALACPGSLIAAIKLAIKCASNQKKV